MVQICLLSVAGKRGTGLAGKTVTRLLEQRDERRAARLALGKRRGGLDLGQHGAATELVGLGQTLYVSRGQRVEPLLVVGAKANGNLLHGRQDNQASASSCSASFSAAKSLSMTAAAP